MCVRRIYLDAVVNYKIVNPKLMIYSTQNLPRMLSKLVQAQIRNVSGTLDVDKYVASRVCVCVCCIGVHFLFVFVCGGLCLPLTRVHPQHHRRHRRHGPRRGRSGRRCSSMGRRH